MKPLRSIQSRIVFSAGVVLLVTLSITAVVVDRHIWNISVLALDSQLELEAESLASLLRVEGESIRFAPDEDTLRNFDEEIDVAYFQVSTSDEIIGRSRTLNGGSLPRPAPAEFEPLAEPHQRRVHYETMVGANSEPIRLLSLVVATDAVSGSAPPSTRLRAIAIQVARTFHSPTKAREEVREAFGIAIPLALLCGLLGVFGVAWASLRPIARMSQEAERIGHGAPSRLHVERLEGELRVLGMTLNAAFDRLADTVLRERRFSADVAHELRTPLAVLKSRVELALQRERSAEDYRAALDLALESCRRVERVANDLLLLAKTEAGGVRARAVDLRVVVAHALESVREVAALPPLPVRLDLPDSELLVAGNEALLERLVANLFENALRHGGSRIEAQVYADQPDRAYVRVRDRGPGFTQEYLARAFERFARGDASRSRDTGGAGLGLAIVDAIARSHGGGAAARNLEEGGAEVEIWLPLAAIHLRDEVAAE